MSSVWETLNAVKALHAATETTARQQGCDEAAQKRARQFFEHMITNLVESRIFAEDDRSDAEEEGVDNEKKNEKDDLKLVLT